MLTDDLRVYRAIQYLQCDPEIVGRTAEELTISVEGRRGYYRILENGEVLGREVTPRAVMECLHAHLFKLSLIDYPTSPLLHAASLRKSGRRFLLVGDKGTGKTSLTLRLIQEAYEFEGDENVFVTSDGVIARPRALRVKESIIKFMPGISEMLLSSPYYVDDFKQRIYNLDPRIAGAPAWRIGHGNVNAVFALRPHHGGLSSMMPLAPLALIQKVIFESALHETARGRAISTLASSIGNVPGFDLSLGDHTSAVACISSVFQ